MAYLRNLAALAAMFLCAPVWPASPDVTAIQACAKVADDRARLACFDRQVVLLGAESQAQNPARPAGCGVTGTACEPPGAAADAARSTAAPPAAGSAGGTKLTPEQKMGLTRDKVDKLEATPGAVPEPRVKELTAAIRSVSVGPGGRQVFVLNNDQIWRQAESKPDFSVRPGDTVRVSRGALGSFWLSANVHSATRVDRVR